MRHVVLLVAILIVTVAAAFGDLEGLFVPGPDHPAIEYRTRPSKDAVSELNRKIQKGNVQLKFDGDQGYLRSILDALDVPIESQLVVFSKTSLQMTRINPRNPRTLFFNDSVAIGWVRGGGIVELAAEDPQQGVIFYTVDQKPADKPIFVRHDDCLNCHESYSSLGVPGMLVRSVFPASDGTPMRQFDDYITDHRSPFEQRWGGWYVTGKHVSVRHMGNAIVTDPEKSESLVADQALDLGSLNGKFDTDAYLSPYSDIIALMVFEHQMHMINLFTRVGWEIRFAEYQERVDRKQTDHALSERHNFTVRLLAETTRELVDYLLFVAEAPLAGKVRGTSGFTEKFSTRGPRDTKGRSLRQFDLERRLMRYPCSYMIYSEAFDGLPVEAKDATYKRMWQILSGEERDNKYARFSRADREAAVEILRETKRGLPKYFEKPITR